MSTSVPFTFAFLRLRTDLLKACSFTSVPQKGLLWPCKLAPLFEKEKKRKKRKERTIEYIELWTWAGPWYKHQVYSKHSINASLFSSFPFLLFCTFPLSFSKSMTLLKTNSLGEQLKLLKNNYFKLKLFLKNWAIIQNFNTVSQ